MPAATAAHVCRVPKDVMHNYSSRMNCFRITTGWATKVSLFIDARLAKFKSSSCKFPMVFMCEKVRVGLGLPPRLGSLGGVVKITLLGLGQSVRTFFVAQ